MRWRPKEKSFGFIVGICVIGTLAVAHDRIGIFVWNQFHASWVALALHRDARFAVDVGNYYFNTDNHGAYDRKKASYYFQRALEIDPRVPGAWHQLARIDFLHSAFVPALEKINKQIDIHGDSFMASFYIRGLIEGYLGDFAAAERDFQIFKAWDPKNWAIHNDLAWIYFQKGDFSATENEARAGLKYNPDNAWLLTAHGIALFNLGRTEEAKLALIRAQEQIALLTEDDWHTAYPGNDPRVAPQGLAGMKKNIADNLLLLKASK